MVEKCTPTTQETLETTVAVQKAIIIHLSSPDEKNQCFNPNCPAIAVEIHSSAVLMPPIDENSNMTVIIYSTPTFPMKTLADPCILSLSTIIGLSFCPYVFLRPYTNLKFCMFLQSCLHITAI